MSSPKALHSHTVALTPDQAETLRTVLAGEGFDFEQKPYMLYAARNGKVNVAVYEKGPKAVIQGKGPGGVAHPARPFAARSDFMAGAVRRPQRPSMAPGEWLQYQ